MKNPIVYITSILFPFLSFSQWTSIIPYSQNIMIYSPISGEAITLGKNSDTVWFTDWKRDLELFGMPNTSFTGKDFSEIDLIDSMKLEEAYNAACVGCPLKWPSTPKATIEFPEMNFLYRGYDNMFKLAASWPNGATEYRIEATDATVKTVNQNNLIMHTINPKGKKSEVRVIYKDAEGIEKEYGPWTFAVRMMPKPIITTTYLSKSKGGEINIGMPADFSLEAAFLITKLEFNGRTLQDLNMSGLGENITPDMLKKIKVGKYVPLIITAINILNSEEVVINGAIQVTE